MFGHSFYRIAGRKQNQIGNIRTLYKVYKPYLLLLLLVVRSFSCPSLIYFRCCSLNIVSIYSFSCNGYNTLLYNTSTIILSFSCLPAQFYWSCYSSHSVSFVFFDRAAFGIFRISFSFLFNLIFLRQY